MLPPEKRCAHNEAPPPQRLITWGRMIVAAHMLEDPYRSANGVAMALGFPSGSAFRNTCQRYLHANPRALAQLRRDPQLPTGGADQVRQEAQPNMPMLLARPGIGRRESDAVVVDLQEHPPIIAHDANVDVRRAGVRGHVAKGLLR